MGGLSIWHILVVVIVVVVLFGKGRISGVMEDLGQGIKGFKKGMNDDAPSTPKQVKDQSDIHAASTVHEHDKKDL